MVELITDSATLKEFCASVSGERFVTVDTEFMRERTYYPELCLVQVAGEKRAACIDPLAKGMDLSPLYALLLNSSILKVFHACRQDMEIFYYAMKAVPAPVFDTQIAAMVCGFGESVSYENLVSRLLGVAVDKSSRFTDWSKRPLSEKQLVYAQDDVLHLREVYLLLEKTLQERGRNEWIAGEMHALTDISNYEINPDEVWRKLRVRNYAPRYLAMLQAVAKWRELAAQEKNVPRGRIMKDDTLAEVAGTAPEGIAELQAIRGFTMSMKAEQYQSLFAAIRQVKSLSAADYPRMPPRPLVQGDYEALADLLRLLLKKSASENGIVPRLIADKDELEQLASGKRDDLESLTGWRYSIFGKSALELLEGKIAIRADGRGGVAFVMLSMS